MKAEGRIVLVSKNDTCKGPMAAGALRQLAIDESTEIVSRGVVVLFSQPINEKAKAVMVSNGVKSEEVTTQLEEADFEEGSLVIALEEEEYKLVLQRFGQRDNFYLLAGIIGDTVDISDPYGQDLPAYGACYEEIEAYMQRLDDVLE